MALIHLEHSSMFQRNEDLWKAYENDDYSRADGIAGYAWMCRYTLSFLDAYLQHDPAAMAFLKKTPAENGVPLHLLATNFRQAKGTPISFEAFRTQVGRQGFDQATSIYGSMQQEKPEFKLDEALLRSWASELIDQNHLPEAVDLLMLTVQIHPESSDDREALGEAYMKAGQKQLAIDASEQSIKLDADNEDAKSKLNELRATVPSSNR